MSSQKWSQLASMALLSCLAVGCTEPRPQLPGCMSDDQCNGARICGESGRCVEPAGHADAGPDADASSDTDIAGDAGSDAVARPDADASADTGTDTSDAASCTPMVRAVAAIGTGGNMTGTSVTAEPGEVIGLDGTGSEATEGSIESYEWRVVAFPYVSTHPHLEPAVAPGVAGEASFAAHAVGEYTVELTVYDASGAPGCETALVSADVRPSGDIFVELVWDTPDDPDQTDRFGADLDLHYRHPDGEWGYEPLDIYWYNPTADWGRHNNPSDDPELIRDDEDGGGPESVAHPRTQNLRYSVGVYYYDDMGFGASDLTLRVYLDGTLAHEVTDESMSGTDTFYEALTIDASNQVVHDDDRHYEGYPPAN